MDAQNTVKAQRQQRANRILARLREVIPSVLTRYPVDAAYVYGSVARGTVMPFSDLDVALLLSPPLPPPYERLKLELTLQGDIEDACDFYPVARRLQKVFLKRVHKEGLLYGQYRNPDLDSQ